MGQFNSDLMGPSEVETWDTLMGAQDPNWNQPAPQPYVEPAADPMYAPAPELSYQEPYVAPEPMYGGTPEVYGPPAPEPQYAEPMQDPFQQMLYQPAQQMGYAEPAPFAAPPDPGFQWAPEPTPGDLAYSEGLQGYLAGEEVSPEWYEGRQQYNPMAANIDSWESPQNALGNQYGERFSTVSGDDISDGQFPNRPQRDATPDLSPFVQDSLGYSPDFQRFAAAQQFRDEGYGGLADFADQVKFRAITQDEIAQFTAGGLAFGPSESAVRYDYVSPYVAGHELTHNFNMGLSAADQAELARMVREIAAQYPENQYLQEKLAEGDDYHLFTDLVMGKAPEAPALLNWVQSRLSTPAPTTSQPAAPTGIPQVLEQIYGGASQFPWAPIPDGNDLASAEGLQGYLNNQPVAPEWVETRPSLMPQNNPSLPAAFGWNGTSEQPYFNNPQFAQSNAQFDATTNPANRDGAGILGGIQNVAETYGANIPVWSDFARETVIPGLAGSLSAQNPLTWFDNPVGDLIEKGNRLGAESFVPVSLGDVALTALPGVGLFDGAGKTALRGYGQNLDTLGRAAGQIDELPIEAARGALTRASENPAYAPDVAELVSSRRVFPTAGAADDVGDTPFAAAKKTLEDQFAGMKKGEIRATLEGAGFGDEIVANKNGTINLDKTYDAVAKKVSGEAPTPRVSAAEDAAGLAARQTPGMDQIPDDVAAAIQRGATTGKAATVADELGAVAEGSGEQALQAALKRAEKMPLDSETLLGVSELTDESRGIVAEYIRNTKALTAGVTQDVSRLRSVATKITGNIDNRVVSEYARQDDALYREIINAEAKAVDATNNLYKRVVTEGMSEADAIEMEVLKLAQIESIYRKATEATQVLRQSLKETLDFRGQQILADGLKEFDAERIRAAQSLWKQLADVQQPLKEIVLGGDISTIFQQGLRGARVGGTSALTGGLGRTANLVAKSLGGEGDLFGIYMKNGLTPIQQMRADGVRMGAEAVDLTRNRLPTASEKGILQKIKPAWNVYQKWNDKQFKAVDKFKQMVYEGRLMQEKAMRRDITDPKIRRSIADFVNTAGSTASRPTAPMRGEAERALTLTGAMTRAQVNELTQPIRALTSRTEARNFLNQALSTASVIGLAWQVQQQFGPEISLEDFIAQSFDPNNPKMFGKLLISAGGKTYVNSFLPQASLATTFVKTYADIASGDNKKIAEDWAKFGFGRQNIGMTTAENLGGFGYGKDGRFFWGDMPNDQRAKEAVPLPLTVKAAGLESGVNYKNIAESAVSGDPGSIMDEIKKIDPYLVGAQATGELAYAESDSQERIRNRPELQKAIDLYYAPEKSAFATAQANLAAGEIESQYSGLLRAAKSYEDLEKRIDAYVDELKADDPLMSTGAKKAAIKESLGIAQARRDVIIAAFKRDPEGMVEYFNERGDDIPKYVQEALGLGGK